MVVYLPNIYLHTYIHTYIQPREGLGSVRHLSHQANVTEERTHEKASRTLSPTRLMMLVMMMMMMVVMMMLMIMMMMLVTSTYIHSKATRCVSPFSR